MAIDILPVSSDTTIAIASVSSVIPIAARCLVPSLLLTFRLLLVGNTAPAQDILSPWIITPPSWRGLFGKKIDTKSSLDVSAYRLVAFSM